MGLAGGDLQGYLPFLKTSFLRQGFTAAIPCSRLKYGIYNCEFIFVDKNVMGLLLDQFLAHSIIIHLPPPPLSKCQSLRFVRRVKLSKS